MCSDSLKDLDEAVKSGPYLTVDNKLPSMLSMMEFISHLAGQLVKSKELKKVRYFGKRKENNDF